MTRKKFGKHGCQGSLLSLIAFWIWKASVALYLMAKHGVLAGEDGMQFDLFKFKKPYGIIELSIAQLSFHFLSVAAPFLTIHEDFDEWFDLFLEDSAGLKV
ncbi:hypothetical protein M0R45_026878 [Rubus argutus]|uniref:Uncharacterized protein n=1 Tax=Rubus argutus TaxID=59490 RepID=A0AAW1WYL6_RUBAR